VSVNIIKHIPEETLAISDSDPAAPPLEWLETQICELAGHGEIIPACPPLPCADGDIRNCHDARIAPDTIVPAWYGDRLNLDLAIWACFANASLAA